SAALSNCYDLRCALKAVNNGIYVYYSKRDCLYLGVAMRLLGSMSKDCIQASGKVGFRVYIENAEDPALYAKLYQRGWTPSDIVFGNRGNHYGNYQPDFLRAVMIPVMLGAEPAIPSTIYTQLP